MNTAEIPVVGLEVNTSEDNNSANPTDLFTLDGGELKRNGVHTLARVDLANFNPDNEQIIVISLADAFIERAAVNRFENVSLLAASDYSGAVSGSVDHLVVIADRAEHGVIEFYDEFMTLVRLDIKEGHPEVSFPVEERSSYAICGLSVAENGALGIVQDTYIFGHKLTFADLPVNLRILREAQLNEQEQIWVARFAGSSSWLISEFGASGDVELLDVGKPETEDAYYAIYASGKPCSGEIIAEHSDARKYHLAITDDGASSPYFIGKE